MSGALLVAAQFALLVALALPWSAARFSMWGTIPIVAGVALLGWTLTTNRPSNISALPQPRANATLVTSGAYRHVRHPMYLALLIGALGLAIGWQTALHALAYALLALVLHAKAIIEEAAMRRRFPEYDAYCRRTPRIVPFLRR